MHFNNLFVFGRPGGGKTEFVDFMRKCEPVKRLHEFHIAQFNLIDDFFFLWELGENEDILDQLSMPRKITETVDDGVIVVDDVFFKFVSKKINRIFARDYMPNADYYKYNTLLIEFSRGEDGIGYRDSLSALKNEILNHAAVIYIKVSFDEAMRRNEARYQEKLKHSLLAHKVPEKAMERFYRRDDWEKITKGEGAGFLEINNIKIPFVTMENEPEIKEPAALEKRYSSALSKLAGAVT